ncbi:MAG TPA: DUF6776 family protein, partial [Burkholderiales bacterium]
RPHVPWHLRGVVVAVLVSLAVGSGWWLYDAGRRFAGFDQAQTGEDIARLGGLSERLGRENDELRGRLAAAESQLQIERAAHEELGKQVKSLGDEITGLKEDLAFFQNLIPSTGKEGGIQVHRFAAERDAAPGEYRYGLLLVQTGQRVKEFQGSLQLVVNIQHNGMRQVLTMPEDSKKFPLGQSVNFKYYRRVEGRFRVAPDAVVESLQLRLFQNGTAEALITETAKIS